ncbi:MAG: hypothetical protein JKY34_12630 [Kordiimonadaceae bacterium]|nr:hypothetical protein [Kordiimonadaceae bacterium]PCJ37789.1 MAG: DUF3102 domain-containing protein [Cellvibrionales bacterium]
MSKPPEDNDTPKAPQDIVSQIEEQHSDAAEHSEQVMAIYGDGLPYEQSRLMNETRFYLTQSADSMLEAGKRLIIMKEHEPHGTFQHLVENDLQIEPRLARKMMQAAVKFLSPRLASKRNTFSLLGKSKIYELMLEDEDDLEELAEGGTFLGMDMDDIERMSSRELRKVLRDRRADDEAKDRVSSDQRQTIQDLQTQLQRAAQLPPDEIDRELREEAGKRAWAAETGLRGQLRPALQALSDNGNTNGIDVSACIAGFVNQVELALADIRLELNIMPSESLDDGMDWDVPPSASPETH